HQPAKSAAESTSRVRTTKRPLDTAALPWARLLPRAALLPRPHPSRAGHLARPAAGALLDRHAAAGLLGGRGLEAAQRLDLGLEAGAGLGLQRLAGELGDGLGLLRLLHPLRRGLRGALEALGAGLG